MTAPAPEGLRRKPAVGDNLRKLLVLVLALFAVLAINSTYLAVLSLAEWIQNRPLQDYFFQLMFLLHLALGLLLIPAVLVFALIHIRNTLRRPNRRAVRAGFALFATSLVLLVTGILLTRGIPYLEVKDPDSRDLLYWLHVAAPLLILWLFVLHRLAGPKIRWRAGGYVGAVAALLTVAGLIVHAQDPRRWNVQGPVEGERYFFPSLARTATGNFIPGQALMRQSYCEDCHADNHEAWAHSAHRFASFNNPAYLFSVRNTRQFALDRDSNVQAARFCAGCHDPVPFFSGAFDDPAFDDVNHPTSQAGITCTTCHAITHIGSPRGNADYTIEEPLHYPFAFSENPLLRRVNHFLVKANPDFHKRTFLKPLHRSPQFCGTCHKVHLPEELNAYKWLRGQNHYDSYHLSGVSGHGIESFYYPPQAEPNCNGCHMPLRPSDDFGARTFDDSNVLQIHDHQFAGANTAIPHMLGMPDWVNEKHREFLEGSVSVDLFGIRSGGSIRGALTAPLRPEKAVLEPGREYLLDLVLRTRKLGHHFTQGTADSNEVWLDVSVWSGDRLIGRSGGLHPDDAGVDPWSHFVNAYVLDRQGRRIDRRNAEDIFTTLYNNQIPPGAADVVHYRFAVPAWVDQPIVVEARLQYRKFDTTYLRQIRGEQFRRNDLPITTIASDRVVLPVDAATAAGPPSPTALWERWNDYGIGLLRRRGTGELRQAEAAFAQVVELGRAEGALNLARVYLREGRVDDAADWLGKAMTGSSSVPEWSIGYFTALVDRQNGFLDEAIAGFRRLAATDFSDARSRGFDFGQDYRLLNVLAQTLLDRGKLTGAASSAGRSDLDEAVAWFSRALEFDPENVQAHYGLAQTYRLLGNDDAAARHLALHARYKPDDNARDFAIAVARSSSKAADHAAEDIVIYDLQRPGAFELPAQPLPDAVARTAAAGAGP